MNRFQSLLAIGMLAVTASQASTPAKNDTKATDWYPVTVENRPFVRWWWLGSAVDPEGLTFNIEEFAKKGLGGVEITPIYGVKGNEANDISYLSPKWMEMLGHTIAEGNRLGLQIDMNNGTGWPFGGPEVTTDYSARKRVVESWTVAPGKKITDRIAPKDAKQRPVATLQAIIACNGDKRLDITSKLRKDSILSWKAPKGNGDWTVYALFSGRTFQKVKRAAPGGEGLVVNHYDSTAINHYLDRFDRAFKSSGCPIPDTFFNDSYEVYGSDWADNMLDEFYSDHGYRLEMYLPEFLDNKNHDDLRSRLVRDYRATLARMLRDNFTEVWMARAHRNGARIRNQSHGSPANIIDLYAAVDIPECESFGQTDFSIPGLNQDGPTRPSDADPAVLKFASSAAHLTGKRLTSAETLTWLTEHFRTSLSRCKPELDQMFCSGVNHVYFHGAPYSPKGAKFPGWMFYASINMSPTNSIWQDADSLFGYVARCQSFLSAGVPDNDFLLYFPIEEIWQRQGGNPYLMFDIHKMHQRMPDIKRAIAEIIKAGYDADYISDELLNAIEVSADGRIKAKGGANYGAIIVPPARFIQPATLNRLLTLAKEGASVLFIGCLPSDVPGLSKMQERRDSLKRLTAELPSITGKATATSYGKGRIITAPDFSGALLLTGIKPESMRLDNGLSMIRRRNESGGHNYFISLLENRPLDGWVTLTNPATAVEIFDPVSGRRGLAQTRKSASGETQLRLQLEPGESLLLKSFPTAVSGAPQWAYVEAKGQPMTIDKGWSVSFPKTEPAIPGIFATDTLTQWCNIPVADAAVCLGTGRYTVEFVIENPSIADDWLLDLGDVRESADIRVNGQPAGKVWSVPFTLRIGHLLRPGVNTLEIDVTNLQANRIADYERRGVNWRIFKDANIASVTNAKKFSFGEWPAIPSGLNSKVTLTPLTLSKYTNPSDKSKPIIMKKLLLLALAALLALPSIAAEQLPPRKKTLETLIKVNDHYLKKHPDPLLGIPYYSRKKVYEANIWTRAVYFEGLMALHSIYPDNRYYDYAYKWGDGFKWGIRRDDTTTRNADNYCCGQTYVDLYRLTPEPQMLTKTKACMNMLINTPQVDDWTWIDAIQMGMPLLAKMSALTGDQRYNEKAWEMYEWSRNTLAGGLYNEKEGLWWRDKDFVPPYKEPNGKNCYWSRGNGWVVAALVKVLQELPENAPHRDVYIKDLKAMCEAAAKCQRSDGFWNVSLHDESNFGGKETTGTALFVYGMAWGINNGILDREKYLPVVTKAWNAIVNEAIHPDGYIGYVQGTGKEPKDGQPVAYDSKPDFDDYGTGCVLLAGTEVYKL